MTQTAIDAAPMPDQRAAEVLDPAALSFLAELHTHFDERRRDLLELRELRRERLRAGELLDFLPETAELRASNWRVAVVPADLQDRRVEITGPTDRKMVINALNSGARGFMADFEDACTPTWHNLLDGQRNLIDAIEGTIEHQNPDGRVYRLGLQPAKLHVRPRGWHLDEPHLSVAGEPIAGALADFGLYLFHCGPRLVAKGETPCFYLPKLESHQEARLWCDVFTFSERYLDMPLGTIRSTVLIETLPAAFEMDEILYELRDHSAGLNAGRWDYMFSMIKCFREREDFILPDREEVTMAVPMMRAYTELLVKTCHRRGAHAIGGMAAFIPSRSDSEVNERAFAKVQVDKAREAGNGFDGTWVSHPDLVAVAQRCFDEVLGERPNQLDRLRDDVAVSSSELLDAAATPGRVTEAGVQRNLSVALRYISSWLAGRGAAAIDNLMEDVATAEIARSQIWQWIHHSVELDTGVPLTRDLTLGLLDEIVATTTVPESADARRVLEEICLRDDFPEFLTLVAYPELEGSAALS